MVLLRTGNFDDTRSAVEAFNQLFTLYRKSIIVLSYSSNGYPDKDELEYLLKRQKSRVSSYETPHRYHFGTHDKVERAEVSEYLIVGQ